MTKNYPLEYVLKQIDGSGGITLTVAQRLGCDWLTAKRYVEKWETTKRAFEAEREKVLDVAESVVNRNIQLAYRMQNETQQPVDSGDAKWVLSRLGKSRGYADKQELELGGKGQDGAIVVDDSRSEYHSRALAALAKTIGNLVAGQRDEQSGAVDASERSAMASGD